MDSPYTILLVEDDIVDVMTVKRALADLKASHPLRVAPNGEEAMTLLGDPQLAIPGLIILDLNMPRMNGIEFLRTAKSNVRLRRIPIVVLTTSRTEDDRRHSYDLGAAGYLIKPVEYATFLELMRCILQYWNKNERPPLGVVPVAERWEGAA
jgi:CheY-like chemotaxis protein